MTERKPPNIVVINPDQMRWDYASCYGHPFIDTRHIDRLAAMGTRFEHAFAACPMCGPSRTSFLTGTYPNEHGVRHFGGNYDPGRPNALAVLGEAGYVRGLWGKDHVFKGRAVGRHYDEGENIVLGVMGGHPAYKRAWDSAILRADSPWNITRRLTDCGIRFIQRHAGGDRPFFLTLNYQDPHPFFTCPRPWATLFSPAQFELPPNFRTGPVAGEIRRLTHWRIHSGETEMPEEELKAAMAMYCGQIRYVDDQVGRLLDRLETLDLLDNTIVLFWSDHGEFLGDYGVTHKMPAFYDALVRVPLILWDPTGRVAPGVHHDFVELMDAMATVLDLCDLPQPAGSRARVLSRGLPSRPDIYAEGGLLVQQPLAPIDGHRLRSADAPTAFGPGAMLRTAEWKICLYADDLGELYDLTNDPHEMHNLYADDAYIGIRCDMQQRLIQRMLTHGQDPADLPEGEIKIQTSL